MEFGLSLPPLMVVFQFNPVELSRSRSLRFAAPRGFQPGGRGDSLRRFHERHSDLTKLRDLQDVSVAEENIAFDIRLDASEGLNEGDPVAGRFGISPRLSTLELMVRPKGEGVIEQGLRALVGSPGGFSYTKRPNPPLVLFVWGRKRVVPVNINGLGIVETEYSADLSPVRATVSVSLTVIEGKSVPQMYTNAMKEAMSMVNLANIADAQNVMIPG
ncbi:hypothetical protein ABZ801_11435 [Actinomadura sp. NPDC047616]|uniref:hypothetical protein n=1 Tax=Actinomadura sp. NPDC047616 TaxID=3155914 RepID=UPI0033E7CD2D